jgi:LuxR family maltose regulon positive regulatory protein
MLGVAIYERGDLIEAERLLMPALEAMEQGESWYELLARGYWAATGLARIRGGLDAALAIVQRARRVAALRDIARLEVCADVLELRERVLAGEAESSRVVQLEASLRAQLAVVQAPRVRYRIQLALAHLELAQTQCAHGCRTLDELLHDARADGHNRARMEALLLRAVALHAAGDAWRARREFDAAVVLAMFENQCQVFRDLGPALLPLVESDQPPEAAGGVPRVSDGFLQSIADDLRARSAEQAELPLSERERAVLRLLAQGLTNKAIARALQVSENTVKFHLKNVFAKLGVDSRAAAVRQLERSG